MHSAYRSSNSLALGACLLALAGAALAQNAAPASAPAPQPAVASTAYAIGAQRNGVSKCIGRINQVTNFLTGNAGHSGKVLASPTGDTNQRLASTVIETEVNGLTSFVSASYSPGAGPTDCSATYDQIRYWPASCAQVAASSDFATLKAAPALYKNVVMLEGTPVFKVFLMPAGAGCVSIKKDLVY